MGPDLRPDPHPSHPSIYLSSNLLFQMDFWNNVQMKLWLFPGDGI